MNTYVRRRECGYYIAERWGGETEGHAVKGGVCPVEIGRGALHAEKGDLGISVEDSNSGFWGIRMGFDVLAGWSSGLWSLGRPPAGV